MISTLVAAWLSLAFDPRAVKLLILPVMYTSLAVSTKSGKLFKKRYGFTVEGIARYLAHNQIEIVGKT